MRLAHFALTAAALAVALAMSVIAAPQPVEAGVYVGVNVGGYRPYYHGGYRPYGPYGYRHYYGPGPVVVVPPPAYYPPPAVVYASPPVVYASPPVVYAQPQVPAIDPGTPIYQRADGQYCREYNSTARIEGRNQAIYGTACRQPDGSWQFVN
ncbi:MAG: hypothetical protein PW790_13635 [Parvibaculaceae bacterium]|nr:hypothetical protein [Parvibaculaceae bacterium]